jgi:hypothetical protein
MMLLTRSGVTLVFGRPGAGLFLRRRFPAVVEGLAL